MKYKIFWTNFHLKNVVTTFFTFSEKVKKVKYYKLILIMLIGKSLNNVINKVI